MPQAGPRLRPPVASPLPSGRARGDHPGQDHTLSSGQGHPCVGAGGPPRKAPLGESLPTEPIALAVVEQQFARGARAVPKDGDSARKRVVAQALSAYGDESIDAVSEIDGLSGHKDAALRAELEHRAASKKACTHAATDAVNAGQRKRRRAPSGRSSSISTTCVAEDQAGVGGTSTHRGEVAGCESRGGAMCFFSRMAN